MTAKVLDIGFTYDGNVHTPTVLVGFAPDDWAARDAFAALAAAPPVEPANQPITLPRPLDGWCVSFQGKVIAAFIAEEDAREYFAKGHGDAMGPTAPAESPPLVARPADEREAELSQHDPLCLKVIRAPWKNCTCGAVLAAQAEPITPAKLALASDRKASAILHALNALGGNVSLNQPIDLALIGATLSNLWHNYRAAQAERQDHVDSSSLVGKAVRSAVPAEHDPLCLKVIRAPWKNCTCGAEASPPRSAAEAQKPDETESGAQK